MRITKLNSSVVFITSIPLCMGTINAQSNNDKPNVVLILADDMGYSGLTSFGGIGLTTPTLDRLASEGVVCTNFHTNAPVSSPTRVSILTGSYQQRTGLNSIYSATDTNDGLEPGIYPSLSQQLHDAGYSTAIYGKWHLGLGEQFNPTKHGFDDFKGFLIGNVDLASHRDRFNKIDWWHNTELLEEEGYGTDLINRYAVEFIKKNSGSPFFLYVTHGAIHTPIIGPGDPPIRDGINPPAYDNAADMDTLEYRRRYREMVKSIDDGLKMIVDELKAQDILENTVIIFLSDNGAERIAGEKYPGANGFFNGHKSTLYEGGIRVPAIIYFPKLLSHKTNGELMMSMDLMPTILDLCGISPNKPTDGISLMPTLKNCEPLPKRDVFWANGGWLAAQSGEWKMVLQGNRTELFNMFIDPKEQHNLSSVYPEKTSEMKRKADNWWAEVTKNTKLEGTTPLRATSTAPTPQRPTGE